MVQLSRAKPGHPASKVMIIPKFRNVTPIYINFIQRNCQVKYYNIIVIRWKAPEKRSTLTFRWCSLNFPRPAAAVSSWGSSYGSSGAWSRCRYTRPGTTPYPHAPPWQRTRPRRGAKTPYTQRLPVVSPVHTSDADDPPVAAGTKFHADVPPDGFREVKVTADHHGNNGCTML